MPKKFLISYLSIFFTLLVLMSLSSPLTEKMRGHVVAFLAPIWEKWIEMQIFFSHSSMPKFEHESGWILSPQEEMQRIQLENQLLKNELSYLNGLLDYHQHIHRQIETLSSQSSTKLEIEEENYQRFIQRLKGNIDFKIQAVPARVIFRSLDSWNYSLWINIGEADNESYPMRIIAKNSPVLMGDALVGVIDYVGRHQSRIRLITDPSLALSVRAVRGGEQESLMSEHIDFLLNGLNRKHYSSLTLDNQEVLVRFLKEIQATLQPMKKSWYLAKGELEGSRTPLGRGHSQILHGTGFNYDFPDEEGEARDLRTGKFIQNPSSLPISILRLQDILVTTGMDGIFPAGLKVASVTKIEFLKEGDYFYELEAKPIIGNLNELSLVFVIPPLGYDKTDEIKH